VEDGAPNGGDGNSDGVPDSQQDNVVSLPNAVDGRYVTLVSPAGTGFSNVDAIENPSPGDAPAGVEFPVGFFGYTLTGIAPGGNTTVTLLLPAGETVSAYYKHGPTPGDLTEHWYEFAYNGTTGAEILGQNVTLHFVDGDRGDDDLTANAEVAEPGGPALVLNQPPEADAGENIQILSADQAFTLLEGTASDEDGDALEYRWLEGCPISVWRSIP
jgi:hypothetical protein